MTIPTVRPISTPASFTASDVQNTFRKQIKQQHNKNYTKYLKAVKAK